MSRLPVTPVAGVGHGAADPASPVASGDWATATPAPATVAVSSNAAVTLAARRRLDWGICAVLLLVPPPISPGRRRFTDIWGHDTRSWPHVNGPLPPC